jgi:hypothetical protein
MPLIASILYPVDFSPSLIAMAAAAFLGARISLVLSIPSAHSLTTVQYADYSSKWKVSH